MKVMLVDDDYPVLEFISQTVPWQQLGLQLHSMQENGQSAYEAALADMPDIVLTDIGMPRMDGLELLAKLKEKKPNLRAAILSCHNEFHYAQQAMKLNVQDYLLKDMLEASDLLQLLRRLKESLEQEARVRDQENQLRRMVDRSRELMKERFIRRTIDQPILSPADWQEEAEAFGLRADLRVYVPVLLSIDRYRAARNRFISGETLRYAMDNVLEEAVAGLRDPSVHFAYGPGQSFVILMFQDRIKRNIYEEASEQIAKLQEMLQQGLKLTCTAQIGEACEHQEAFKGQLVALLAGSAQRFYMPNGSIAALKPVLYDDINLFAMYDEISGQFRDRFIASDVQGVLGEYGVKIEGADSLTDSRANTEAMAASGSELAQKVLALEIGGHSDWAIPARDVQELQYRNLKPTSDKNYAWGRDGENHSSLPPGDLYSEESPAQTSVEAFKAGGAEAFRPNWYWSSTQRSASYAFGLYFSVGSQYSLVKSYELRVRPVRSEIIQ